MTRNTRLLLTFPTLLKRHERGPEYAPVFGSRRLISLSTVIQDKGAGSIYTVFRSAVSL